MRRSLMLCFLMLISAPPALGDDWPQFLGPKRNGISAETGLIEEWPEKGLREVWRVRGGGGMSGLSIGGGKCVTMVQREGKQRLVAISATTGAPLWDAVLAPAYENQMGDGPRSTPTIAGNQVFAMTGEGILAACSLKDGSILWSVDLPKKFGGKLPDYGMAVSPLVADENVIVTVGLKHASVVALDAVSGKIRWSIGDDPAGYSSPALMNLQGQEQVVAFTGASAIGLSPRNGALFWRFPFETDYHCNIAVPLEIDGDVFISSGENHGCARLSLAKMGEQFVAAPKWESLGPKSVMRNEWQTSILLDGRLYGFDNVGGAGPVSHFNCVDAANGKRLWQKTRFGKGNLIAADGKFFIVTIEGDVVVAKVSPEGFQELGRQAFVKTTRQAPSLSGGLLYLRDEEEIVCIDVRKK